MASSHNQHWNVLSPFPGDLFKSKSTLIKTHSSHFLTISDGICEYDTIKDKWHVHNRQLFHDGIDLLFKHGCCYDPVSKQIFKPLGKDTMSIFDIQTNKLSKFKTVANNSHMLAQAIWMDGCCHLIGGFGSGSHHIWNNQTKQLEHIHNFRGHPRGFGNFGLIYVKNRKELLLFGGEDCSTELSHDIIYKYSLLTQSWTTLDAKLPMKLYAFGYVMLKCQRFIIILGGMVKINVGFSYVYGKIFVLELETMKCSESKIKLPFEGECEAIIMENENENDLLVHGFIKREMNKYKLNVPFSLIALIGIWHCTEYIHVIKVDRRGSHWKINVDKILNE